MRMQHMLCCVVLVAAGLPAVASAQLPPAIELRIPKAPTIATTESGQVLAYELHVTSFTAQPLSLKKIDVMNAAADRRVMLSLSDSSLLRAIARPGMPLAGTTGADRLRLAGGTRAVVYLWVPVEGTSAPRSVVHRITVETGAGDSVRTQTLDGATVPVATDAVVIGPPLRGGVWLAANGPANESGHRRALIPVAGTPAIAQRFAIDYVRVDSDDKTFTGNQLENKSYHAEGNDALAVANGTVVATKDSIPENVPGITSRAVPITLETVSGNSVVIDLGDGRLIDGKHRRLINRRIAQPQLVAILVV